MDALSQRMPSGAPFLLTENIAGLSRDPAWLIHLVHAVGTDRLGLLPDFGNFNGDRRAGLQMLLPFAKSLCAKSSHFADDGLEASTDYFDILSMARKTGFNGDISIEYVGKKLSPIEGVRATENLLQRAIDAA